MLKCLGIFPVLGRDFFFLNASKFVFGPGLVVGDTDVTTGQVLAAVSGTSTDSHYNSTF